MKINSKKGENAMKRVLTFLFYTGIAFADQKGVIEAIDATNKTIIVNGMVIKVLPNTKIEEDSCWLPWDISKKFVDLKIGDIVELDLIYHNEIPTATEIEIQCIRDKAY